ncbi:sulfatase [Marinilongibacter aquaticus]|uniref:sulfatase family protein n=1 Tax=Marinilongibacter aquaticus TaxID=2975157 RepID=UPI0021BDAF76|nr:sulfatase [Marinilongibacter aquaticus]UBM58834.1 sulfatase [Marinilongibacter aquaticus]
MKTKSILVMAALAFAAFCCKPKEEAKKPNILFCIADDWGWPHALDYGDSVVQTPAFNQLAKEGVLFDQAFISSPSCTPSRGAVLTGQDFWRLGEGANLWSSLDSTLPVYPLLLEKAGYFVGSWRKAWGPGDLKAGGYVNSQPAGKVYKEGFEEFLNAKPADQPFCFWLGASDPHRPYEAGTGAASGIDLKAIDVPGYYPDEEEIRSDLADYYFEVNRFDSDVQTAIELLKSRGELENTIVVVTGDHGMPFPRCKGNLYEMGTRVPLVIRYGDKLNKGSKVEDLVSLTDLAPTFLDFAGLEIPDEMTGHSLKEKLLSKTAAQEPLRDFIVYGRERHTPAQESPSMAGYPSRAIRTADYLYILNLFPDRWPAGVPEGATHPIGSFADCDDGPTKQFIIAHQAEYPEAYALSFGLRPKEELYAIKDDPMSMHNLADQSEYRSLMDSLSNELVSYLKAKDDPRFVPSDIDFDAMPYRSGYKLHDSK